MSLYIVFNGSSDVYNISKSNVSIYPNPVVDFLRIDSPVKNKVSISTIDGRLIKSEYISEGLTDIDLSSFTSGVYLVMIDNRVRKVVKN